MRLITLAAAVCLALLPIGCGGASMEDLKAEATTAFQSGDYDKALASAEAALEAAKAAGADKIATWNLEDLRLKAVAGLGDAEEALHSLDRLAADFPTQINAERYTSVAHSIKESGDLLGAIDVIEIAKDNFADASDKFDAILKDYAAAASASADPRAIAKLKELGYL